MSNDHVIGRGAIIVLLAIFLFILLVLHAAHAIKHFKPVPVCLPSQNTDTCSVSPGSNDESGFLSFTARKGTPGATGDSLGGILFLNAWEKVPECTVRGEKDYPLVRVIATQRAFEVVLTQGARLPSHMRWFYVCQQ